MSEHGRGSPGRYRCDSCGETWERGECMQPALQVARNHGCDGDAPAEIRFDPGLERDDYDVDFGQEGSA